VPEGDVMTPYEPTVEDIEEYLESLEIDEMFERDETIRLMLEAEEIERERKKHPCRDCGHPAQETEFDSSEEDNQPSYD
jgi:hypothetical protein